MMNYKTSKQIASALNDEGYRFKYRLENNDDVYRNEYGKTAIVSFNKKTIDWRG